MLFRSEEALHPFADKKIQLEYYIITGGLKAILEGSSIYKYFTKVYGCEYDEKDGKINFPRRAVAHSAKVQYLYRINKGLLDPRQDVNESMPDHLRPIPFDHMIYVGDGATDIPAFIVTRKGGGKSVSVYNPKSESSFKKCVSLNQVEHRTHYMAPGDYRPESHLYHILKNVVQEIASNMPAYYTLPR